jgi:holo-[acyl-carrier protein] synthase
MVKVGIDLVSISRIAESVATHGDRFLARLFTPDEIAFAIAAPVRTNERLAARFAAKEAAMKALGLAGDTGVDMRELEIAIDAQGAPSLVLHGAARRHAEGLGVVEVAVSFSHEGDLATAVVVATTR